MGGPAARVVWAGRVSTRQTWPRDAERSLLESVLNYNNIMIILPHPTHPLVFTVTVVILITWWHPSASPLCLL